MGQRNGQEDHDRDAGVNLGSERLPKAGTEEVDGKKIQGAWGELPDYVLKHGRGSMPSVPEKYMRYLEALIKQTHERKRKKK